MPPRVLVWILACIAIFVGGCGGNTAKIAPVEGQILFNGLPARASITAQSIDSHGQLIGRPSNADTRADGTFTLVYAEKQPGVLIGPNRVTISVFPVERESGEFDFQERFRPVKVVRVQREVLEKKANRWNFVLTY